MSIKKLLEYIEMTLGDESKVKVTMVAAAGVICKRGINNEKMVLLIQRAADDHWPLHWEFPRGKCDKPIGEAPNLCVIREIKEETGLDVEIKKYIDKFEYLADKGTRRTICYNFLCKMKDPDQKIKLSKEHESFRWITQVGEAELFVMPDQKKILEKVLSIDNSIISHPENSFTKNNKIDEFLKLLQDKNKCN